MIAWKPAETLFWIFFTKRHLKIVKTTSAHSAFTTGLRLGVGFRQLSTCIFTLCMSLHCKKGLLSLAGNNLVIPEFGSDIPAGDGKIANIFNNVNEGAVPTQVLAHPKKQTRKQATLR